MCCCSNLSSTAIRLQLWSVLASESVAPQLGIKMLSVKLMTWTSSSTMWIIPVVAAAVVALMAAALVMVVVGEFPDCIRVYLD